MEAEVPEVKLREFFDQLTAKSGGKLSLDGFLKLNYELYLNRTEKEARKQFSRLDKDASDSLDFEEVKTLLKENWVLLPERRKELRKQLDRFSDDEYLDMELLSEILTKFGNDPIDEDNVSTFISDLDWNADGRISKDELTIFLLRGHEWDTGKQIEITDGDVDKYVDETSDNEEEPGQEDEPLQDEGQSLVEVEKTPSDEEPPNEEKQTEGDESSDSDESSQEESADDDDEDSRAEKTSDDEKAKRKAKKAAKKAKKAAKKEAKQSKKGDQAADKTEDDYDDDKKEN